MSTWSTVNAQAEEEARRLAEEVALLEAQNAVESAAPVCIIDFESFAGAAAHEAKKLAKKGSKGGSIKEGRAPASSSVVPSRGGLVDCVP